MGIFRRRESDEQRLARESDAIAGFWAWWIAEGRAHAAAVFDEADATAVRRLGDELAQRLREVGPLDFETGQGRQARHVLVVSAGGNPDLRDLAARWRAAAPPADDAFEYADSRQPVRDPAGLAIDLGDGRRVDIASAVVATEVEGSIVHVDVWHPVFGDLPDDARGKITFLFLDALLGEEVVERNVGAVAWVPPDGHATIPLLELRGLVDGVRGQAAP